MITAQLKITTVLIILFLTVNMAAKAIGSSQPPNPALQEFITGCQGRLFPCWNGIVPGVTTVEEAHEILNLEFNTRSKSSPRYTIDFFKSYSPLACPGSMTVVDNVVNTIDLPICEKVSIQAGELIAVLGMPPTQAFVNADRPPAFAFGNDREFFYSEFSLDDVVGDISISYVNTRPLKWRGLIPQWRYCQLEPRPTMQCP
jgi:hypothetical protein